ncbi:MAG: hypothetical protein Q8K79_11415 [Solirubrobacteraceae bacterium]|nr:hypothetical protein [Solirubrobacteraceae bacterium]
MVASKRDHIATPFQAATRVGACSTASVVGAPCAVAAVGASTAPATAAVTRDERIRDMQSMVVCAAGVSGAPGWRVLTPSGWRFGALSHRVGVAVGERHL